MKKQKSSNSSKKQKTKKSADTQSPADKGRRRFLGLTGNGALGVLAAGGLGLFFVQQVRSSMHEHDLSRIGNGTPTVVQIHDPECSICLTLQRETREALQQFDGSEVNYVVANIRSAEGRRFANQFGVQHVTLLLFDGNGEHQGTLHGQRQSEELAVAFRRIVPR